jgi:mono/diheme cytochrome c family protein
MILVMMGAALTSPFVVEHPSSWLRNAWAASQPVESRTGGDRVRGRSIFNGIGGCFNCHGYDGDMTRRPHFSPKIADELAHLNPKPANLRNPATLKAEDGAQRFQTIKFGHPGTAMFPKKFLSDQEIIHVLAYLATLRAEATAGGKDGQ